jgi:hypothetical protein
MYVYEIVVLQVNVQTLDREINVSLVYVIMIDYDIIIS